MRLPLLAFALLFPLVSTVLAADEPPAPAKIPAGIQHGAWDSLVKKYVNEQGLVAYKDWKASAEDTKALDDYLGQYAAEGKKTAEGDDLTASCINGYNAFAIRWIFSNYPAESIQELKDSFTAKRHSVAGEMVSLEQIEHGTLRPHIGWRAHAVLVCCARSCPPLQRFAYVPEKVDAQIDTAYRTWLAREDLNKFLPAEKKIEVSSVFKWFENDFKKAGGLGGILTKFAPEQYREFLGGSDYKIEFMKYHWGLNDQSGEGKDYSRAEFLWDQFIGKFK